MPFRWSRARHKRGLRRSSKPVPLWLAACLATIRIAGDDD